MCLAGVPFSRLSAKSDLGDTRATGNTSNMLEETTPRQMAYQGPKHTMPTKAHQG